MNKPNNESWAQNKLHLCCDSIIAERKVQAPSTLKTSSFFPSYIMSFSFTVLSITTYIPIHKDVHTCNMHTCIYTY